MNDRQVFLDRVRELTKELEAELVKPKIFTKEAVSYTHLTLPTIYSV